MIGVPPFIFFRSGNWGFRFSKVGGVVFSIGQLYAVVVLYCSVALVLGCWLGLWQAVVLAVGWGGCMLLFLDRGD
jgi:hypothetical protein